MKRVFISQPMNGKNKNEIMTERNNIITKLKEHLGDDIQVIDSIITEIPPENANIGLWYLSKSLELLSTADIVVFPVDWAKYRADWKKYRGCIIEQACAVAYGIENVTICDIQGGKRK